MSCIGVEEVQISNWLDYCGHYWIPHICSHKIQLVPDHKPSIENQRRINTPIQKVVKKEIIKKLDAEVIYTIADSSWVCLVQCVPKKAGMIVVRNEKNEIVPTRW